MKRSRSSAPARRPPAASAFELHGSATISPAAARVLERLGLAIIALVALALLAMLLGPHRIGDYFAESDFYGAYADGARALQHGHVDPARYGVIGPVYETTLALVGLVIRNLFVAAELISLISATLTLWLWFEIVRRRLDARAGVATVALLASNAYFFRYGYAASTDALAIALQAAALAVLLLRGGTRAAVLAGVLAALAFLTRYNAIYLLPAGVVAVLAGGTPQARRGRATLAFAAGFMAPVLPWVLFSLAHGSRFEFQLHHNIAYEVFARARGITWDHYQRDLQPQFHSLWDVIRRDPGAVARQMFTNLWHHVVDDARSLTGLALALCAAAGVSIGARDHSLRRLWPVWLAAVLLYLTLVPVFYSERYSLALLPAYAALAALALASPSWALVVRTPRRVWLKAAAAVLVVALAAVNSVRYQARVIDQLPTEVLRAADTLRALESPGDRLIARKGHLGFHAGLETVPFPFADSLGALAKYAHEQRVRWMFVSWPEVETRPAFYALLDTSAVMPGLTPRCVTRPHPGVLYEIGPEFGIIPAWVRNDTLFQYHMLHGRVLVAGQDPEALYMIAITARALHEHQRAQSFAILAAKAKPADPLRWTLLGMTARENGDVATSLDAYQRALTLDPESVDGRLGLGVTLLQMGDSARAVAAMEPMVDRVTNPVMLMNMLRLFEARHADVSAARTRARLAQLGAAK